MRALVHAVVAAATLTAAAIGGAAAAAAESEMHFFESPSGNIACLADSDWVRCDVRDRDWSPPPRPADCPSQTGYGQGINLEATGKPEFVCAGDTTFGGDARTLQYGDREKMPGYSCVSETSGIRCENRDGHGFEIARDSYRLF
ncbi:DUF6636 domain-containing protein [Mycolicibacter algericus]|uniref:Secreted protein n=2 Tax=Mycolicibacter algericus TaxID=1288388 RepID=A0A7I9YDN0_MYCAL|nr:DUF6636 domain-containing protein [Mycolicibacter algericus]OQZ97205.1 hypothetical protein BST10_09015 [Mycolicibacter algericus DSM 45454]GFG86746.1 hypothetical protein MALGJ_34220 [Mycolicibacter algericus]